MFLICKIIFKGQKFFWLPSVIFLLFPGIWLINTNLMIESVIFYGKGLNRLSRMRINYGDIGIWLWSYLTGHRDGLTWTHKDIIGAWVRPEPEIKIILTNDNRWSTFLLSGRSEKLYSWSGVNLAWAKFPQFSPKRELAS